MKFLTTATWIALAIGTLLMTGCLFDSSSDGPALKISETDSIHGVAQILFYNGQLIVANHDTAAPGIAVIDTGTGKVSGYYSEHLPPSSMAVTSDGNVIITETNYVQGAISIFNPSTKTLSASVLSFGADNFVDTANGQTFLFDHTTGVVTGFTGHTPNLNITLNAQTGAGSNPYDVAITNGKAYIPRYNLKSLLILDATLLNGGVRDSIDLSAYAKDTATNTPHMAAVTAYNGYVFVTLQRLTSSYAAHDTSLVVVINASTKAIVTTIPLHFRNPISAHVTGSTWYLTCIAGPGSVGSGYGDQFGGVEKIDLSSRTNAGVVVNETDLGADVFDFVATGTHSGYAAVSTDFGTTTKLKKVSY